MAKITLSDIVCEDSNYEQSFVKLIGKKIKDIRGYISNGFGFPTFKLTRVEFDDGTFLYVEGEHDFPYFVVQDEQPNFDAETLKRLLREDSNG